MRREFLFAVLLLGICLCAEPGAAQSLSYADLAGLKVEVTIVEDPMVLVVGKTKPQRAVHQTLLSLGPGQTVQHSHTVTITQEIRGKTEKRARTWTSNATLGQPYTYRDGQRVWIFENNALTSLRTKAEGGAKLAIAFSRAGDSVSCKVDRKFAREVGVDLIVSESSISGNRVEILSAKEVSNSCSVSKP